MTDITPIYNLKAVIKETGLSPATIRAWEHRYGLFRPPRTPGGHRIYSRQDIKLLKWLIARQQEGLSISQAVEMWKIQQESAPGNLVYTSETNVYSFTETGILKELREQWMAACQAFNEMDANQVLNQAFATIAPETVSVEILQKGLAEIGKSWYSGVVSAQQEHFASVIALRRLDVLITALPAPTRLETILVACPPGEQHDFILLLVTYLLRRQGWNVLYLGANLPLDRLDQMITTTRPALVISAAQTLTGAASLSEMARYIVSMDIPLAYGGGIFNEVPATNHQISGYYLGTSLSALPGIIEMLMIASPEMPDVHPLTPEYTQTLDRFLQHESAILVSTITTGQGTLINQNYYELANNNLTRMIESALRLGNIHLLDQMIVWLDGLLSNRGISSLLVKDFYRVYRQTVDRELGDQAKLIGDWLEKAESMIS
jgi:MerR family transcriptional regulator, light-induced transcriptional regulator